MVVELRKWTKGEGIPLGIARRDLKKGETIKVEICGKVWFSEAIDFFPEWIERWLRDDKEKQQET